jgi:hypothetical protein
MKKVKKAQGTFDVPFSGFCISAFLHFWVVESNAMPLADPTPRLACP